MVPSGVLLVGDLGISSRPRLAGVGSCEAWPGIFNMSAKFIVSFFFAKSGVRTLL
jgi:hypothetical protein